MLGRCCFVSGFLVRHLLFTRAPIYLTFLTPKTYDSKSEEYVMNHFTEQKHHGGAHLGEGPVF